jgi:hypothetical protein
VGGGVLVCFTSFLVFFVVAIAVCFRAWLLVDASIGMVAVVFMVLVVVVTVGREVVLSLLLVGQELVDEAFCLGARRCWRAAEMGWDRVVGNEGALATVGVGRVEDDLLGVSCSSRTGEYQVVYLYRIALLVTGREALIERDGIWRA